MNAIVRWHAVADADALARVAAGRILAAAQEAIRARGRFSLVLAGGSTPRATYGLLRAAKADWGRWSIWFGDERCVPADDAARNSVMARGAWLDHVAVPCGQIQVPPAELGAPEAAAAYGAALQEEAAFDLVLLGLGEDGHTASLFPGKDWGATADSPDVLPVVDAPKPPPERISLSAQRLSRAREVLFLVAGEGKRAAVRAWRAGSELPVAAIQPPRGVDVLIESALLKN